jgi:hypothetical protein
MVIALVLMGKALDCLHAVFLLVKDIIVAAP